MTMLNRSNDVVPAVVHVRGVDVDVAIALDEARLEGYLLEPVDDLRVGLPVTLSLQDGRHALIVPVNDEGRFLMSGPFH